MKLGFLASNSGSSFRAILAAIEDGSLDAEARVIVSNKAGAPALRFAATHGLPTRVIPTLKSPDTADAALVDTFNEFGVDLVILSGYLRKLGPRMLDRFHNRVLNIHPSLLPRHGGHGMYGRRVHDAVLAAGDSVSGATVHIFRSIVKLSAQPCSGSVSDSSIFRHVSMTRCVLSSAFIFSLPPSPFRFPRQGLNRK